MIVNILLSLLLLNISWSIKWMVFATNPDSENNCPDCKLRLPSRYGKRNNILLTGLPINHLFDDHINEIMRKFWKNKNVVGRGDLPLKSIDLSFDFFPKSFKSNNLNKLANT